MNVHIDYFMNKLFMKISLALVDDNTMKYSWIFQKNIIIHECSYWLLHEQIIHENFISFQVDDNTMKYSWSFQKTIIHEYNHECSY